MTSARWSRSCCSLTWTRRGDRPSALRFDLTAGPDLVERLENVIGGHLVRFGGDKDTFVVAWTRADGSPGTRQDANTAPEHVRRPDAG